MDSKLKIAVEECIEVLAQNNWRGDLVEQLLAAIGPIQPDAGQDERAEFEAWFKTDELGRGLLDRDSRGPGYMAIATTCAWNAWQAGRAYLTAKPAEAAPNKQRDSFAYVNSVVQAQFDNGPQSEIIAANKEAALATKQPEGAALSSDIEMVTGALQLCEFEDQEAFRRILGLLQASKSPPMKSIGDWDTPAGRQASEDHNAAFTAKPAEGVKHPDAARRIQDVDLLAHLAASSGVVKDWPSWKKDLWPAPEPAQDVAGAPDFDSKLRECLRCAEKVGQSREANGYAKNQSAVNRLVDLHTELENSYRMAIKRAEKAEAERDKAKEKMVLPDIARGALQALCIAASQESASGQGIMSDWDRGYLQGQFQVFKLYVCDDITALNHVEQYIADLFKLNDDARAAQLEPQAGQAPVGFACFMPGTGVGFTMCAFNGSDVPAGTALYTAPQPAPQAGHVPVAYVPIHPRTAQVLWASAVTSLDADHPSYEMRPVFFAALPASATKEGK